MSAPGLLLSMARMSGDTPRIGRRGAFTQHDLVTLTLIADVPTPVQVDGDYLGLHEKLTFRTAERAIRVLT